jgi:ABC-type phosphate/phosphonate transport system substrate-binding protein
MKKILSLLLVFSIISCTQSNNSEASYSTNELIFVVEMDSNEGKSIEDIKQFSQYYTDAIDKNEPNSMGWGFYEYEIK